MYALGPSRLAVNRCAHMPHWDTMSQWGGMRKEGMGKNRLFDCRDFFRFGDAETGENVLYRFTLKSQQFVGS